MHVGFDQRFAKAQLDQTRAPKKEIAQRLGNSNLYLLSLPSDDFINEFPLFTRCSPQIDAGGFDGFVAHEVGE